MPKDTPSRLPMGTAEMAGDQLSGAELEIVLETARDLTSLLSTQKIIERLLDRLLNHLDSEIGSVLALGADDELRIIVARGLPDDVVAETRVALGEGISGFVARTGEPLLVDNIESDERFGRRNHERYYTRSCLSAPLMIGGALYGVINVNNNATASPSRGLIFASSRRSGTTRRWRSTMPGATRKPSRVRSATP